MPQTARYFATGVTTLTTAVDDNFFLERPLREKRWQQFVPAIFIQWDRARDMILFEFIVWPRVYPDRVRAPRLRLIEIDHLGRTIRRLPGNFVAKVNCLADRRHEGERDEQ